MSQPPFYTRSRRPANAGQPDPEAPGKTVPLYYWRTAKKAGGPVPAPEIWPLEIHDDLQVCRTGETTWQAPAAIVPPPNVPTYFWRSFGSSGGPVTVESLFAARHDALPLRIRPFRGPAAWQPLATLPAPAVTRTVTAPPPAPVPAPPSDGWRTIGWLLLTGGLIGLAAALAMDTTAPGTTVTNLSMQHSRIVCLLLALAACLAGFFTLILRPKIIAPARNPASPGPSLQRTPQIAKPSLTR